MSLNEEISEFPCGYCDEIFDGEMSMVQHIRLKHVDREKEPKKDVNEQHTESKGFTVIFDGEDKTTVDDDDDIIDTFECHPCLVKFKSEALLARHIQDAHEEDSSPKDPLEITQITIKPEIPEFHDDEITARDPRARPYKCSKCDKCFLTSSGKSRIGAHFPKA